MFIYKNKNIEVAGELYELNELDKSKVCYDDIKEYCEQRGIRAIASIETIHDFAGATIEEYQDIFNEVKNGYTNEVITIIPLHNLMYNAGKEFISSMCASIEEMNDISKKPFNPFPFCKYTRYVWHNPKGDDDTYNTLIPMALKHRFIRTINKERNRYALLRNYIGNPSYNQKDISDASIDEIKDYAEYLSFYMKDYFD